MKHGVALAFVSLVAFAIPACSDNISAFSYPGAGSAGTLDASSPFPDATTGSNRGDCDAYLSCLAHARPDALASALAAYGPNGTCWNGDSGIADICRTACQTALADTCSDGGADAGSTSDASVDASSDAASDAPECTKGADCGDGRACERGACTTCGGADGPCACALPGDCGGGLACVSGICSRSATFASTAATAAGESASTACAKPRAGSATAVRRASRA